MKYKCTRDPRPQRLHTCVFEPASEKRDRKTKCSRAEPVGSQSKRERERISNIEEETGWARVRVCVCVSGPAGCIIYQIKWGISVNASKSQRNGTLSLALRSQQQSRRSLAVLPHNSHLAFIRAIYASLNCLKCYSLFGNGCTHGLPFLLLTTILGFYQKEYGKSSLCGKQMRKQAISQ
jgi:hypothetical protein